MDSGIKMDGWGLFAADHLGFSTPNPLTIVTLSWLTLHSKQYCSDNESLWNHGYKWLLCEKRTNFIQFQNIKTKPLVPNHWILAPVFLNTGQLLSNFKICGLQLQFPAFWKFTDFKILRLKNTFLKLSFSSLLLSTCTAIPYLMWQLYIHRC